MTSHSETEQDLGWLPRRQDFRFVGITHDGSTINCIMKRKTGLWPMFYVAAEATGESCWSDLVAWRRHA